MTYCNVTGNRRRWEIMLMPGDDPEQLVKPETLWRLVSHWVTPEQADIERAVIYTFHSVIAQGWRKGRLMLAGDAAHQTPPFLGQGMCAAIRDVANLAWKLEAVLRGRSSEALLDTYESERAPHVHAFIDLAVRLGDIIQTTDPEAARQRDAKFKAGQPEMFQFPAPRLGPGVWHGDAPAVGRVFPQPLLRDGHLLDARLGSHFAVIGDAAVLSRVSADTRARWQVHGVVQVVDDSDELHAWLTEQGVRAVMLRPDRYVMGVANTATDLDAVTCLLPVVSTIMPAAA
jgi:3-(3-hydroxy-phenyl)propionate hydroxylase